MNRHTALALGLVALLALPAGVTAAAVGSPSLSTTFTENTVLPGQETALTMVVVNSGDLDRGSANPQLNSEVTTARGLTLTVENGSAPFTVISGKKAVGTLPEGATGPIPVRVAVHEDAKPGTYRVPIEVDYRHTSYASAGDGSRETTDVSETLHARVHVEERASLAVVDVNSTASVGAPGTVTVTVRNDGSEVAHDAQLTLASRTSDVALGGSASASRHVGRWAPGENRTVTYSVTAGQGAEPGPYAFDLTASYENENGRERATTTQPVGVQIAPESSFAVDQVESTLRVGDEGQLRGVVRNTGNRTVEDAVVTWASDGSTIVPTETEYAVGTLGPDESAAFDFEIEVSDTARSGPRQFDLVVRFSDDDQTRRSDPLAVRTRVGPDRPRFDVATRTRTVTAGSGTTIEIEVTNTGNQTVSDLSAKLFADSPISTTDDEAFVARLEPGASATLVFGVSASGGALEKAYPMTMDMQYDEPDGDTVMSDSYKVPLSVRKSEGGGFPFLMVGGAGAVGVALVGTGIGVRRR